jgi:hypothetical protein
MRLKKPTRAVAWLMLVVLLAGVYLVAHVRARTRTGVYSLGELEARRAELNGRQVCVRGRLRYQVEYVALHSTESEQVHGYPVWVSIPEKLDHPILFRSNPEVIVCGRFDYSDKPKFGHLGQWNATIDDVVSVEWVW